MPTATLELDASNLLLGPALASTPSAPAWELPWRPDAPTILMGDYDDDDEDDDFFDDDSGEGEGDDFEEDDDFLDDEDEEDLDEADDSDDDDDDL